MNINKKGIWLALAAAVISGVSNFVNKPAVTAAHDAIAFTTIKNAVVAVALVGLVIVAGKTKEISALNRRERGLLLLVGLVGGSVPFALYFSGLALTSAVNAALIHKTLFFWVAMLAVPFLKEKLNAWQWAGAAGVFAANLLVGGFHGFNFNAGEAMVLAAAVLWAIENVIAKRVLPAVSATTLAASRLAVGSVVLLPFLAWRGGFATVSAWGPTQWGWIALTAGLLLVYVLTWYSALKHAPATLVTALLIPATLVTNILTAVFVTHSFTGTPLVSILLFVVGTALLVGTNFRSQVTPAAATV